MGVRSISAAPGAETAVEVSRTPTRVLGGGGSTVVVGPAGAGKTQWVDERRRWGDLVVDVDALYQALSGLEMYEKPQGLLSYVLAAQDAVISRLEMRGLDEGVGHAWVITSLSSRTRVEAMAQRLGATLVVLDVDANECLRRIANDERRADKWELWEPIVRGWWREWDGS